MVKFISIKKKNLLLVIIWAILLCFIAGKFKRVKGITSDDEQKIILLKAKA